MPQQRSLVVAWLSLLIVLVGHCPPVLAQYKELGLDPGLQPVARFFGSGELPLQ